MKKTKNKINWIKLFGKSYHMKRYLSGSTLKVTARVKCYKNMTEKKFREIKRMFYGHRYNLSEIAGKYGLTDGQAFYIRQVKTYKEYLKRKNG